MHHRSRVSGYILQLGTAKIPKVSFRNLKKNELKKACKTTLCIRVTDNIQLRLSPFPLSVFNSTFWYSPKDRRKVRVKRRKHAIQKQLAMVPSPGFIQFRKVVIVLNSGLPGIHIQNRRKMTTLVFLPQDATQLQFPCNSSSTTSRLVLCHLQI